MWKMNIATKQRYANTYSPQESHGKLPKYVYIWKFRLLSYNLCKYTFTHGNMLESAALALISGILCKVGPEGNQSQCRAETVLHSPIQPS